uniref:Secreted protein n=1 Tax=Globisporangium ultimum (strain ATCC 200006 / CBS 805.95 / DAOM BR144) TaxID=431595 RepID=K3WQN3_GLOUD
MHFCCPRSASVAWSPSLRFMLAIVSMSASHEASGSIDVSKILIDVERIDMNPFGSFRTTKTPHDLRVIVLRRSAASPTGSGYRSSLST